MSLFWNDWVGLAAFGAAFPMRAARDHGEGEATVERDGFGFVEWLRSDRRESGSELDTSMKRDPDEERLFAAFLSCPWL